MQSFPANIDPDSGTPSAVKTHEQVRSVLTNEARNPRGASFRAGAGVSGGGPIAGKRMGRHCQGVTELMPDREGRTAALDRTAQDAAGLGPAILNKRFHGMALTITAPVIQRKRGASEKGPDFRWPCVAIHCMSRFGQLMHCWI